MKLLKILHRLSYLFVIPMFIVFTILYGASRFVFNIFYWILTGDNLIEEQDTIVNMVTKWADKHYPL